ncbi:hypothetical protein MRX96_002771 [Rhipicephalus microplus]
MQRCKDALVAAVSRKCCPPHWAMRHAYHEDGNARMRPSCRLQLHAVVLIPLRALRNRSSNFFFRPSFSYCAGPPDVSTRDTRDTSRAVRVLYLTRTRCLHVL